MRRPGQTSSVMIFQIVLPHLDRIVTQPEHVRQTLASVADRFDRQVRLLLSSEAGSNPVTHWRIRQPHHWRR